MFEKDNKRKRKTRESERDERDWGKRIKGKGIREKERARERDERVCWERETLEIGKQLKKMKTRKRERETRLFEER